MNYIIKKGIIDPEEGLVFKYNDKEIFDVAGTIRLFIEGNPPTPTDLYLLLGDFPADSGEAMKPQHSTTFNKKLDDDLKRVKANITNYGAVKLGAEGRMEKRSFYTAMQIPKAFLDTYTG